MVSTSETRDMALWGEDEVGGRRQLIAMDDVRPSWRLAISLYSFQWHGNIRVVNTYAVAQLSY